MAFLSNLVIFKWFISFSHFPGPTSLNIKTIITCDDSWELISTLNQSCCDEYYIDALTTSYYFSMKYLKNDNKE